MLTRKENELYLPVKRLLESRGYLVRAEVNHCDLVAVRGNEPLVIVELKRSFGLSLVYQGIDRQRITDTVYLAFAAPMGSAAGAAWRRKRPAVLGLCRRLGLGLMTVGEGGSSGRVEVLLDPAPYRPRKSRDRLTSLLGEFSRRIADNNIGGSCGRALVTAYRQDALRCARRLADQGPLAPASLRRHTGVDRAGRILQRNVYGWFERVARGVYTLTPQGRAALEAFSDVVVALTSLERSVDTANPAGPVASPPGPHLPAHA